MADKTCPSCGADIDEIFELEGGDKGCSKCSGVCVTCKLWHGNSNLIGFESGKNVCANCIATHKYPNIG